MATERIVRLPREDLPGEFILLHVTRRGVDPLNLKIAATEGEAPYFVRLKQSQVKSLRSDKNKLSEAEWEAVLAHVLLHEPLPKAVVLDNLSTTASRSSESLELTIRTSTEKITTRLSILSLQKTHDELDAIHWTHVAASHASELSASLEKAQSLVESQRNRIKELETQLENLISERDEAENTLYSKFAAVINTKKLKIRDQQTLLATAKIDPKVATEIRALRDAVPKGVDTKTKGKGRTTAGASTAKRKADDASPSPEVKHETLISDDSTEEDPESEREDVRQLTATPGESEASGEEMAHAPLPTRSAQRSRTISADGPLAEKKDVDMEEEDAAATDVGMTNGADEGKGVASTKAAIEDKVDDDATDEDDEDDEL